MIDQNDAHEIASDVLRRLALKARGMSGADDAGSEEKTAEAVHAQRGGTPQSLISSADAAKPLQLWRSGARTG